MLGRPSATPNVRLIRQKLGLTQEQLAFLMGVTKDTVYRWEHGGTMSPLGRAAFGAFLRQPHVVQQLAAAMPTEEILAAVGEPVGPQAHSS